MNIIGKSECTAFQMAQYLIDKNPNAKSWALEYAQLYLEEGEVEGVRGDGAWIQSCKETHYFIFDCGTAVTFDQNNFCGLGVTRKGLKGHSFETPRLGIRAQIQHLKGYATATALVNPCIDPRYKYISPKGKAPRWEDLAGKWAVPGYDTSKASSLEDAMNKGIGYGFDIIKGIEQMKKIVVSNDTSNKEDVKITYKVAVDAGHGSTTAGKRTPDNYLEHWINVKTAYYCEQFLKQHGIETVRIGWNDTNSTDDADVALSTRQNQIKNAKCDYSISLHANAYSSGWNAANGVETLIHSNASYQKDSLALANKVQARIIKGTSQSNRGVKKQTLAMCNCVAMNVKAACLVEIGFMTNKAEAELMKTDAFCKEQGEDVAKGFLDYVGIAIKTSVSTPTTSSPTVTVSANTYVVQKGDTLSKIGSKTGVAWKTIAEINGIKFPYIIKVGQVLKLTISTSAKPTISSPNKYINNGLDYSLVFNPTYYTNKHADLKKAFGTDANKLFDHFCRYGMAEGRQAIATFNPTAYKNRYPDLQNAFGNNMGAYYRHYIQFGHKEKRRAE